MYVCACVCVCVCKGGVVTRSNVQQTKAEPEEGVKTGEVTNTVAVLLIPLTLSGAAANLESLNPSRMNMISLLAEAQ